MAPVQQRGNLRVRVDLDEAARELITLTDVDEPGIVLGSLDPDRKQLLEQNRHLHPVGCSEGIELQRMLADGQLLLVGGARDRPVDAGKAPAALHVPLPDLWRHVRV